MIRRRLLGAIDRVPRRSRLGGCKIVATAEVKATGDASRCNGAAAFDPDAMVAAIWDRQGHSLFRARRPGRSPTCGARAPSPRRGRRQIWLSRQGGQRAVDLRGQDRRADRRGRHGVARRARSASTRPATASSPRSFRSARRCAARRSATPSDFVSFNDFKNQIDYAQFGKALQHLRRSQTIARATAAQDSWSAAT